MLIEVFASQTLTRMAQFGVGGHAMNARASFAEVVLEMGYCIAAHWGDADHSRVNCERRISPLTNLAQFFDEPSWLVPVVEEGTVRACSARCATQVSRARTNDRSRECVDHTRLRARRLRIRRFEVNALRSRRCCARNWAIAYASDEHCAHGSLNRPIHIDTR
jgi:hypothetical protein